MPLDLNPYNFNVFFKSEKGSQDNFSSWLFQTYEDN